MIYQIKVEVEDSIKINGLPSNEEINAFIERLGYNIMHHKTVPIITITNNEEERDNKEIGDW